MLELAEHILDTKKADFDATKFDDRYEQAMIEMIDVKKAGMPSAVQKRLVPRIVGGTDLMAALRQSIAESEREDKGKAKAPAVATAPKSKAQSGSARDAAADRWRRESCSGGCEGGDKAPVAAKPGARKKAG